jgi:hypothetical protein
VNRKVNKSRFMQHLPIDADFLPLRIDSRAKLSDDLPIDLDAAFPNQLLALAPAGDARRGKHLLQAVGGIGCVQTIIVWRRGPTATRRTEVFPVALGALGLITSMARTRTHDVKSG